MVKAIGVNRHFEQYFSCTATTKLIGGGMYRQI